MLANLLPSQLKALFQLIHTAVLVCSAAACLPLIKKQEDVFSWLNLYLKKIALQCFSSSSKYTTAIVQHGQWTPTLQ